ncbi:unnamed protein product [Parajaminaea phylloscopi]
MDPNNPFTHSFHPSLPNATASAPASHPYNTQPPSSSGLPPELDPDFQQPLHFYQSGRDWGHTPDQGFPPEQRLADTSEQDQGDAEAEQPRARTRTHHLPPTFSDSEEEEGVATAAVAAAQTAPEVPRKVTKVVLKNKKRQPDQLESDPTMVSTRGAGSAINYSEDSLSRNLRSRVKDDEDDDGNQYDDGVEQDDEVDAEGDADDDEDEQPIAPRTTRSGRRIVAYKEDPIEGASDSASEEERPRSKKRIGNSKSLEGFVVDDEKSEDDDREYGSRSRPRRHLVRGDSSSKVANLAAKRNASAKGKAKANGSRRRGREADGFGELEDLEEMSENDSDGDNTEDEQAGRSYRLRERKKVDYSLAAMPVAAQENGGGRPFRRTKSKGSTGGGPFELDPGTTAAHLRLPTLTGGRKGKTGWDALPLSMTGKDYAQAFGEEVDSSDDDIPAARKAGAPPPIFGAAGAPGGLLGSGPAPIGGDGANEGSARDALGRIKKGGDALADIDPLGVNMQVDFDSVGGLDGHIQQLKEMVSLPLLYPEVFQQFKVTPPRGVLFHGPPGTGKTLVARALAASCSTSGQQISFFMRKGADCLSKWVGEAERQLRMLFDEARASQPSIIFFDEIDGLAPVRSSKQDQIHASIVSTLLALMDGMDGRGQVVVIGATNRPDSVDPALRRPGRFDREFYFPLPSREARRSIINIHTKGWEPPLSDSFKDTLSDVTKGYGGADLRALCTEAALNAIQRRYPQIYQTTERLLLQPETIRVEAKDFMMSVNKLVPSSARSSSSAAAPLPDHLKPLLQSTVDQAVEALQKVMPPATKRNPLEEALWEDDAAPSADGQQADGGFGREMMLQSFEQLRIFRPRLVIAGSPGMGQGFVGGALLHHLEGYHVQSLDIGALMGDSARTPEAAIVQLFVEAKRHKPSVVYIPGLVHWARSVSETVRATTKALLDELSPSDPVLLLAIAEEPLHELPADVLKWFGYLRDNKVQVAAADEPSRQRFFADLLHNIAKPPTEFPDAIPRRKRVLEELAKAPPRPPRQATQAEVQLQASDDHRTLEHLKYRLGPVLSDLRKKFKKFTRDVWDEYELHHLTGELGFDYWKEKGKIIVRIRYEKGFRRRRFSSVDGGGAVEPSSAPVTSDAPATTEERAQSLPVQPPTEIIVNGVAEDTAMADAGNSDALSGPLRLPLAAESASSLATPVPLPADVPNGHIPVSPQAQAETVAPEPTATEAQVTVTADEEDEDPFFETRDMTIYTMNLERMQKRLYYNGYLTLTDFMDDLGKIVANAETAQEVDQDRLVRAHQMRNLANILLDQYVDQGFRLECERMAVRQRAREEEKLKAAEEAKRAAEEAAKAPRRPSGERFSARVQGQPPEHRTPVDLLAIERQGKRSRTSSSRHSGSAVDGGERKRARSAIIEEVDAMIESSAVPQVPGVVDMAETGGQQAQAQLQLDPLRGPTFANDEAADVSTSTAQDRVVPPASTTIGPVIPASSDEGDGTSHVVSAPPPHPAFHLPTRQAEQLRNQLLSRSAGFNIDQLLQLRAACFDAVWRHRADWDRTALLSELSDLVEDVTNAVRMEREAEGLTD